MSTLRVNTLQDAAGNNGLTPAQISNGIAKAWVNFNGTGTVAIRSSNNVSSITDNGTGLYTVNFSTAFSDSSYVAVCGANPNNYSGAAGDLSNAFVGTGGFRLEVRTRANAFSNSDYVFAAVFR
jgi:hypothetical protein